jgi:predicted metal-dependent hydrolase
MINNFLKKSDIWHLTGVGDIILKRNRRAKRLTISLRPVSKISVTIPGYLSMQSAKQFVEEKKPWILEKLKAFQHLALNEYIESYKTRNHELKLIPSPIEKIKITLLDNKINLYYPEQLMQNEKIVQDAAKEAIDKAFRKESLELLPDRVKELATKYGFTYNDLRIKKTTSRWGSCSSKNNINLSIYLMKLPDELIDYIILHELTHTIHKNHGPNFWNHLNRITGNAKSMSARVKKYRTGV